MIDWRISTPRDRQLLQSYCCADPQGGGYDQLRKEKFHSEPWALQVQTALRTWRYRRKGSELWLGFEGEELVTAGAYERITGSDPIEQFQISYVSCSYAWRGRRIGDECLRSLVAVIGMETEFREDVLLVAHVHEDNEPSQKMFKRFGFQQTRWIKASTKEMSGRRRVRARYGVWTARI